MVELRPLISVIMPAYNAESYIQEAVQSVLAQTYQHLEIIIVNDASIDHTGLIVENMAAQDDRIRICHNEQNRGVSFSRNLAISCATGEWIAFLDSDDAWHHEKLALQMRLAEQKEADSFLQVQHTWMSKATCIRLFFRCLKKCDISIYLSKTSSLVPQS